MTAFQWFISTILPAENEYFDIEIQNLNESHAIMKFDINISLLQPHSFLTVLNMIFLKSYFRHAWFLQYKFMIADYPFVCVVGNMN